jgi:FK506-binding protein 4/5
LSEEERKEVDALKLPILLNLVACQLKTEDYGNAILNASKALDIDTANVKALYRRAQAYSRKNDWDNAKADLSEGLKLAPNNKELRQELDLLKKNMAAYKDKEKQMFGGIFNKK